MRGHGYDIFFGTPTDRPLWLEAIEGRGEAITRMKEIARQLPGRYFVYCVEEGTVLCSTNTSSSASGDLDWKSNERDDIQDQETGLS